MDLKRISAGVLACTLLASPAAQAQGYVGLSAARSRIEVGCSAEPCDGHGAAYTLLAGYTLVPGLAAEASWYDTGRAAMPRVASPGGDILARGVGAHLVLSVPYTDSASLFGRLGLVATRIRRESDASVAIPALVERHVRPGWGVGTTYELSPSAGVRLTFDRTRVPFAGGQSDIDLFTLGLLYRF